MLMRTDVEFSDECRAMAAYLVYLIEQAGYVVVERPDLAYDDVLVTDGTPGMVEVGERAQLDFTLDLYRIHQWWPDYVRLEAEAAWKRLGS